MKSHIREQNLTIKFKTSKIFKIKIFKEILKKTKKLHLITKLIQIKIIRVIIKTIKI